MADSSDKIKNLAFGTLVGAAAGFVAGVLLAPKSGQETRQDLRHSSKNIAREVDKHAKKLHQDLSRAVDTASTEFDHATHQVKAELSKHALKATKSRDQLASVMSAVRSGNSTDEDLDIAVKNAQSALDSLKKYLKK